MEFKPVSDQHDPIFKDLTVQVPARLILEQGYFYLCHFVRSLDPRIHRHPGLV